mgnify:FL=1
MKIQNKIYLILSVSILICLTLIIFLIYPLFLDFKKTSSEIMSDKQQAALLYNQSQELDYFYEVIESYQDDLDEISRSFVDISDPVSFIEFLEDTALGLDVNLDISLVKDSSKSNSSITNFQVSAQGSFQNVIILSQKIESETYLLKINKLSMSKITTEKDSSSVEAVIIIQPLKK